jgi:hypothetical protein
VRLGGRLLPPLHAAWRLLHWLGPRDFPRLGGRGQEGALLGSAAGMRQQGSSQSQVPSPSQGGCQLRGCLKAGEGSQETLQPPEQMKADVNVLEEGAVLKGQVQFMSTCLPFTVWDNFPKAWSGWPTPMHPAKPCSE